MDDLTTPNSSDLKRPLLRRKSAGAFRNEGVHGWLLLLCLMLTVVGPLISTWLVASEYRQLAPHFADSRSLQVATFFSIAITACSVAFGVYAGLRLWSIKPRAVNIAKASLLFGLAVEILTTSIQTAIAPASPAEGQLFYEVMMSLVPSLIFFTACFAYLNKSTRVEATYQS